MMEAQIFSTLISKVGALLLAEKGNGELLGIEAGIVEAVKKLREITDKDNVSQLPKQLESLIKKCILKNLLLEDIQEDDNLLREVATFLNKEQLQLYLLFWKKNRVKFHELAIKNAFKSSNRLIQTKWRVDIKANGSDGADNDINEIEKVTEPEEGEATAIFELSLKATNAKNINRLRFEVDRQGAVEFCSELDKIDDALLRFQ
mmetsp:Transcript_14375/g.17764  ORF Transcript_14375/g.17764 Transcript_14375/m.17764 type:complete len:204 (+) Transcript_14375:283-894(+)